MIRIIALWTLLLVISFPGVVGMGPPSARGEVALCGAVDPGVANALETRAGVSVIISLQPPPGTAADLSTSDLKINTAERQDSVLAYLTSSDFTITSRYSIVPALAGVLKAVDRPAGSGMLGWPGGAKGGVACEACCYSL